MRTAACLLVLLATSAHAATLKELLDAADQNNVDRRISAAARERAAAEFRQAWTSMLPAFTAQASWTNNQYPATITNPANPTTQITIVAQNQLDGAFRIDLPLIDSGRWFRAAAGSDFAEAAVQREEAARDVVRRQVIVAYYGYAAALALRESATRSTNVAEQQAKLMEVRSSAGASTELDLLRARAEAARNRQLVADAAQLVAVTRRAVNTLSGMDPGDAAALPADDVHPEPNFVELEQNVEGLPQVRAADRDAEAAQDLATAQRLTPLPIVGAQFTERLTNASSFTGQPTSYNTGLTLTWRLDVPSFMGMGAAAANESAAVLAAERARLGARDQIHSDWQRLNSALQKLESAKVQVEANQRAAQVARDRYAAGAATQLDVIAAERDFLSAEVGLISARTELAAARLGLRISSGLPLGL